MNELICIREQEGKQVVSARDLHEGLRIGTEFRKWMPRMIEYGFVENQDFIRVTQKCPTLGGEQEKVDYAISLDMAKEISMIQRSEIGKKFRQYFIDCEKKLKTSKHEELSPQLQLLIRMELEQKEIMQIAKRAEVTALEARGEIQSMRDIISLDTNTWRTDAKAIVVKIAQLLGGNEYIRDVNSEIYTLLNMRMGVNLEQRLTNKRRRMADEGICKSKRDKVSKLDIIAEDKKLIEGYVAIIKEIAVKHGVV